MVTATAVVSCFNSAGYLPGCVAALRRQPGITEIVVVDDHSRDDTAVCARGLGCEVVRHAYVKGLSATRNSGLEAARNPLVAFVDADVVLGDGWLAALAPHVQRPGVALAGGRLVERHRTRVLDLWRTRHMVQDHGEQPRTLDAERPGRLSGFATLARRDVLAELGGYDTRYGRSYEDVDISRRLIERGHRLAYEPMALAHHERTDTLRSLMASCWSYDHWPEYDAGTYHSARRIARKLGGNVVRAARLSRESLARGDVALLPVDMAMIVYHSWWDARYYLANATWLPSRLRPQDADMGNLGRP